MKKKNRQEKKRPNRFLTPVPFAWRVVRDTAATLLAALATMGGLPSVIPNITTPEWFTNYVWYIGAILTSVIAYAQSREKK